jgi:hypothetical protein
MKVRGTSRLVVTAFALVALSAATAHAQTITTTVTASAVGNRVTVAWTAIPFVQGYDILVSGTVNAVVRLPAAAGTGFVVDAPTGTYNIRVRGFLGALEGPLSDEVSVSPGLQPCVPGTTTTVTATPVQNILNATWTPVPGATAYIVQWSRFSGTTELAETVATNSVSRAIPLNGDFFVRVIAVSACGDTTSAEAPFTIAVTRIHLSPSQIRGHLLATAANYPRAFALAHGSTGERYDYIILACRRLYQATGGTVGCNFRRAAIGDLSMDGLSVQNPANDRFYFADVIFGAGGPNPSIGYEAHPFHDGALLRDGTGQYAPWGFANPFGVPGSYGPLRTAFNYGPAGGW